MENLGLLGNLPASTSSTAATQQQLLSLPQGLQIGHPQVRWLPWPVSIYDNIKSSRPLLLPSRQGKGHRESQCKSHCLNRNRKHSNSVENQGMSMLIMLIWQSRLLKVFWLFIIPRIDVLFSHRVFECRGSHCPQDTRRLLQWNWSPHPVEPHCGDAAP